MKKIKTEFKVGAIGLATLVLLYVGINFLKGKDIFNVETNYYVLFDNVQGLYKSNYIYLNGMKVGYIKDIQNTDSHAKKFLVCIAVKSDIEIPSDSRIMIFSADLLGSKALKIDMGTSRNKLYSKDTIEAGVEYGFMDQLGENIVPAVGKLNSVMSNLDTLLINVNKVLDTKTQNNIKASLENIKQTTVNLEKISYDVNNLVDKEKARLEKIIENTESITNNFKKNNEKLTNIINNFSNISDTIVQAKLGTTLSQTNSSLSSLANILHKIEKGEGNMGLLLNDDKLYKSLDSSAKQLNELIEDIKKNPKKYLTIKVF